MSIAYRRPVPGSMERQLIEGARSILGQQRQINMLPQFNNHQEMTDIEQLQQMRTQQLTQWHGQQKPPSGGGGVGGMNRGNNPFAMAPESLAPPSSGWINWEDNDTQRLMREPWVLNQDMQPQRPFSQQQPQAQRGNEFFQQQQFFDPRSAPPYYGGGSIAQQQQQLNTDSSGAASPYWSGEQHQSQQQQQRQILERQRQEMEGVDQNVWQPTPKQQVELSQFEQFQPGNYPWYNTPDPTAPQGDCPACNSLYRPPIQPPQSTGPPGTVIQESTNDGCGGGHGGSPSSAENPYPLMASALGLSGDQCAEYEQMHPSERMNYLARLKRDTFLEKTFYDLWEPLSDRQFSTLERTYNEFDDRDNAIDFLYGKNNPYNTHFKDKWTRWYEKYNKTT